MKEKAQHLVQAVRRWPFAVWCLLTTVAGGLYLSITLVAPLGGSFCNIFLYGIYLFVIF